LVGVVFALITPQAASGLPNDVKVMASPETPAWVLVSVTVTVSVEVPAALVDTEVGLADRVIVFGRWAWVVECEPDEFPLASVAVIVQVPTVVDAV
jgi:hypothetical protein